MGKSPRADATSMVAIFNTAVRQNIGILTGKLASARIFFAHVRFEAETHPAMYGGPRVDKNSAQRSVLESDCFLNHESETDYSASLIHRFTIEIAKERIDFNRLISTSCASIMS